VTRWAVARTAARWEKVVAEELVASGVPVFLPLLTRVTTYRGKRRSVRVPVFGGYVFFSEETFTGNARVPVACRKRIAQILRTTDYHRLSEELQQVDALLRNHELVQEKLYGKPGERVRINGGPFVGFTGTIRELSPTRRQILLEISFLNRQIPVDIAEDQIEKT
jgi:transcription antitermination factor NusG